nr:SDR family oxidoreductase [Octadecabacter antarcticus]
MSTIIVTGASSGIGRAVAEKSLHGGWTVGLIARRIDALDAVANGNPHAYVLPRDVTDSGAVTRAFDTFVQQTGRLDTLFNNAGIFTPAAPIEEVSVDDRLRAINVNLTGMFLCARAAFGAMRAQDPQGGRIINNGSIPARPPRPARVCGDIYNHQAWHHGADKNPRARRRCVQYRCQPDQYW